MKERESAPARGSEGGPLKVSFIRREAMALAMVMGLSVTFLNILERVKETLPGMQGTAKVSTTILVPHPPPPPPPPSGPGSLVTPPPPNSDIIKPGPDPEEPPE